MTYGSEGEKRIGFSMNGKRMALSRESWEHLTLVSVERAPR